MQNNYTPSSALGFLMRGTFTLVTACLLAAALVSPASATHFRYGQITWTQAATPNTVEATVQQAWRRTFFAFSCVDISSGAPVNIACPGGLPNVGDIVGQTSLLDWGDGTALTPIYLKVTSIDPTNDWFFGVALDPVMFPSEVTSLPHDYSIAGPGDYTAFFESCCRISTSINNPDGGYSIETVINIGGTNSSPVTALPPIVTCPASGICGFFVPGADPNGDVLSYRLSLSDEAKGILGIPDEFVQPGFTGPDVPGPNGASIDTNTGLFNWDTTSIVGAMIGDLYSVQVMIEDGQSKVAVDFLIELGQADLQQPTIVGDPNPVCGPANAQTVGVGVNLMFGVLAFDPDPGDALTLNVAGLPAEATMTPPLPASGVPGAAVSSTFSWTPAPADTGSRVVIFTASNFEGGFALCPVTINVDGSTVVTPPGDDVPVFVSTPGSGVPMTVVGETAPVSGTSSVICGLVPDPRLFMNNSDDDSDVDSDSDGNGMKFDIGRAKDDVAAFNDTPPLAKGELVIPGWFGVHNPDPDSPDPAPDAFGLCYVFTDVPWLGPMVLDVDAAEVPGLDSVNCKLGEGIDNDPLMLARATDAPDFVKKMYAITTECDPRGSSRWSDWWLVVNAVHLTDNKKTKPYVNQISVKTKQMINKMRRKGAVERVFINDIKADVTAAQKLFRKMNAGKAEDAMVILDAAAIKALKPPPFGLEYPGSPEFRNPKGDLVRDLMRLRYAGCAEIAHVNDLGSCAIVPSVEACLPGAAGPCL